MKAYQIGLGRDSWIESSFPIMFDKEEALAKFKEFVKAMENGRLTMDWSLIELDLETLEYEVLGVRYRNER